MTLASTDIGGRPDFNVLRTSVSFGINSSDLTPAAKGTLDDWAKTFEGKVGDKRSINQTVNLEGHASATGTAEHNLDLATKRVTAVSDYLGTHGFTNVATRATPKPKGAARRTGARTSAIAASTSSSATATRRSSRCTSSATPSGSTTSTPTRRCTAAAARPSAMP